MEIAVLGGGHGAHAAIASGYAHSVDVCPCPSRKLHPRVAMMQSGQDGRDDDAPRLLDGSS